MLVTCSGYLRAAAVALFAISASGAPADGPPPLPGAGPPPLPGANGAGPRDPGPFFLGLAGGGLMGPFSAGEVETLWTGGQIVEGALIWSPALSDWQEARMVLAAPAPPPEDTTARFAEDGSYVPAEFFPGRWVTGEVKRDVEGFGPGTYIHELELREDKSYRYGWHESIATSNGPLLSKLEESGTYELQFGDGPEVRVQVTGVSVWTDLSDPMREPVREESKGYISFIATGDNVIEGMNTIWRRVP